jgi:hypothetical protein
MQAWSSPPLFATVEDPLQGKNTPDTDSAPIGYWQFALYQHMIVIVLNQKGENGQGSGLI